MNQKRNLTMQKEVSQAYQYSKGDVNSFLNTNFTMTKRSDKK